jgi:hypothetical protein
MIIDDLRIDINYALTQHKNKYPIETLSESRKNDISTITNMLLLDDPLKIIETLTPYIESIRIPFISWLPFTESHFFINGLIDVLQQKKFLEPHLLHSLLREKDNIILGFQGKKPSNLPVTTNNTLEKKLDAVILDLTLLKNENKFLYQQLLQFDQKIKTLEAENTKFLERAIKAEEALQSNSGPLQFFKKVVTR